MAKFPFDITGIRFTKLVVLGRSDSKAGLGSKWLCRCDCGNERIMSRHPLVRGTTRSCGCLAALSRKNGRLAKELMVAPPDLSKGGYISDGLCCIRGCGRLVQGHDFCRSHYAAWRQNGHPLHFLRRRAPSKTGRTSTPEYRTWNGAKMRCVSQSNNQWPNYGGRGIKMCERWVDSFDNFLADMGPRPSTTHTLDRLDVNGHYEPGNCRWATPTEQNRNTRSTVLTEEKVRQAHLLKADGKSITEIALTIGVGKSAIYQALLGNSWKELMPGGANGTQG